MKLSNISYDRLKWFALVFVPAFEVLILTLGERYFRKPPKGLDGNWYMTDMFKKWLNDEGHSNPDWFDRD